MLKRSASFLEGSGQGSEKKSDLRSTLTSTSVYLTMQPCWTAILSILWDGFSADC
jgi:hypothetical protein